MREAIWPSMGFWRLFRYYMNRIGRLRESPNAVAAGFATGVAVSLTPFVGLHLILGVVVTWLLRGSVVAMVLSSLIVGNPWTLAFISLAFNYRLGAIILGLENRALEMPHHLSMGELLEKSSEWLWPMMVGCVPLVASSWVLSFYLVRRLVREYRRTRTLRMEKGRNS